MSDPKESASQDQAGFIDSGEESVSVNSLVGTAEVEPGSAPAEDLEVTPTETDEVDGGDKVVEPLEDFVDENDSKGVQKRIGVLTKKYKDQETQTAAALKDKEAAEANLEALKAENEALKLKGEKVELGEEPDQDDFDTDVDYYKALSNWTTDQRFAEFNEKNQKEADKRAERSKEQAQTDQANRIQKIFEDGAEKHDDFDAVVSGVKISNDTIPVFEELDNADDVAYFLGKNPKVVKSINTLHPSLAGIKLQEISTNLKTKKITKTPAPITPVSTQGNRIKTLDTMSTEEYRKARKKQLSG